MSDKQPQMTYEPREVLDSALESAIGEILSAEDEARSTIARAEESVKSIQLDAATRERDMRTAAVRTRAAARDKKLADSEKRADAECERLRAEAAEWGEALKRSKKKDIEKAAKALFASLGGK